jgi:hypothetical protein
MIVSHGPRPPENLHLKNTCQVIGGASGRTIWASADSESKPAFTRFPESERYSAPVREVASPPDLSLGPPGPWFLTGFDCWTCCPSGHW